GGGGGGGVVGGRRCWGRGLGRRAVGEPGAVSVPGIAGGAVGAALIGAVGLAAGLIGPEGVAIVAAAGLAGSLAESLAFDFGKGSGARLDHDFANAFNTLVGALVALEISLSLEAQRLFLPVAGQCSATSPSRARS